MRAVDVDKKGNYLESTPSNPEFEFPEVAQPHGHNGLERPSVSVNTVYKNESGQM